jgi:hypothetical protein
MRSLFVRALELGTAAGGEHSIAGASRTPADGTFAVASGREGVVRVYAASCAALLHEFSTIHRRVYTLHYTSFSDSLITLESDAGAGTGGEDEDDEAGGEDAETFLCVYHDWRERKMVRGYTLPLGVLESPASRRKADCIAVCSFTGRVVVAMGSVLNVWQCSRGFFEHVMELQVDMAQRHAFLQVEHVAIHGVYVAYASQTEVRVMEIHVQSSKDGADAAAAAASAAQPLGLGSATHADPHDKDGGLEGLQSDVPQDADNCVSVGSSSDLNAFIEVAIPHSSYSGMESETKTREQDEQRIFDEPEQPAPMVLGRSEAQQEVWNLAGLVKSQDIRTNQAMSYFVGESDVTVLLRRYLPPNHSVTSLKFLPETIDNRFSVETRSYTRLLIATEQNAFLYYFLSEEVDTTRKKMSKKVLGKGERTRSAGISKPIKVGNFVVGSSHDSFAKQYAEDEEGGLRGEDSEQASADSESGRVVMHYTFTSPVTSIEANSSFLFVATVSGLQVWSIWSPCHYVAASRALNKSLVPQPSQPQLLCTQPVSFLASQIAALDSYVILLPHVKNGPQLQFGNVLHASCMAAAERLPEGEFETRRSHSKSHRATASAPSIRVFQQSPPSLIFSSIQSGVLSSATGLGVDQIDLLLSLFSLYRYRADIGFDLLHATHGRNTEEASEGVLTDRKELVALELETKLYDRLAKQCAADLAGIFMSEQHRNLERAALLYVASNVPSIEVMKRLRSIMGSADRAEVANATGKYLEAFVFPPPTPLSSLLTITSANPSAAEQPLTPSDDFTRIVLLHYDKHFPEQLARLVIDSSLQWSLADLSFAFEKLTESTSNSLLVKVARFVLVLRASSSPHDAWDTFISKEDSEDGASVPSADFVAHCSTESVTDSVLDLFTNHNDALRHLIISHPKLLIEKLEGTGTDSSSGRFSSSILTQALLTNAPVTLLGILEQVFTTAVGRHETLQSIILFCLTAMGEAAASSARRIFRGGVAELSPEGESFSIGEAFVLRFLTFVLDTIPSLEVLAERDELRDDEETLRQIKASVAMELVHLCVRLVSQLQGKSEESSVGFRLVELFTPGEPRSPIPTHDASGASSSWMQQYLGKRCLSPDESEARRVVERLLNQAVGLISDKNLCDPDAVLGAFQTSSSDEGSTDWAIENDFAALVVLLTLPRVSRYATRPAIIARAVFLY